MYIVIQYLFKFLGVNHGRKVGGLYKCVHNCKGKMYFKNSKVNFNVTHSLASPMISLEAVSNIAFEAICATCLQ